MSDFFSNWLDSAQQFFSGLKAQTDDSKIQISDSLGDLELQSLQAKLKVQIPQTLVDILRNHTGGVSCRYWWEVLPEYRPIIQSLFSCGNFFWGGASFLVASEIGSWLEDIDDALEGSWFSDEEEYEEFPEWRAYRDLWQTSFPVIAIRNGDYIALAADGTSVNYLSHDGHSFKIAESLKEFLSCWQAIGYAGPDQRVLKAFLDEDTGRFRPPSNAQKEQIKELFGSLLT